MRMAMPMAHIPTWMDLDGHRGGLKHARDWTLAGTDTVTGGTTVAEREDTERGAPKIRG